MISENELAKQQIENILNRQGYPTYSKILDLFDIRLIDSPLDDPNPFVAAMIPGKAVILINRGLNINQVSVIIRHEILHEYLAHAIRQKRKEGARNKRYNPQLANIAADYEISNRGYTDNDKRDARSIDINGHKISGLVTEDEHPEWVNLSFEEMLDELEKLQDEEIEQILKNAQASPIPSDEEMDEIDERIRQVLDDLDKSRQGDSTGKPSGTSKQSKSTGDSSGEGNGEEGDGEEGAGEEGSNSGGKGKASKDKSSSSGGPGNSKSDDTDESSSDAEKEDAKDKLKRADKELDDVKDDVEGGDGDIFKTPKEQKDISDRIKQIQKILRDVETQSQIFKETDSKVEKEKAARADRAAARYKQTPLERFKASLNKFIKDATAVARGKTWSTFDRRYSNTNIIRPGKRRSAMGNVPSINVYFDQSGSWDANKIKVGEEAVATLNKYVQRGELIIRLYYFSNNVHSNAKDARDEGGTEGQPILDHIEATKPANVIVMTDSDIHDCRSYVTVPGAVWFLFKGGVSENIQEHLHGQKQTEAFEI